MKRLAEMVVNYGVMVIFDEIDGKYITALKGDLDTIRYEIREFDTMEEAKNDYITRISGKYEDDIEYEVIKLLEGIREKSQFCKNLSEIATKFYQTKERTLELAKKYHERLKNEIQPA